GEPVHVLPHALVRGVEQVRTVLVHLDPGLRVRLRVRVAAEVAAPLEDEDLLAQLGRGPFGDGQAEETGPDDDEVVTCEIVFSNLCGVRVRAHGRRGYAGRSRGLHPTITFQIGRASCRERV